MQLKKVLVVTALLVLVCLSASADWTQVQLPDLSWAFGGTALGHLPDGRYIFGQCGNLYMQDAWNVPGYSEYTGEPVPIDPSFIAVLDETHGVLGAGGWGSSGLFTFSPESLAGTYGNVGVTLQNYHGVLRDGSGVYTGGGDTGPNGIMHGIRYASLDGQTNKIIIDSVSTYSCGFTADVYGNLYVGDNDDGSVHKFTRAQLDAAVAGSPLSMADGQFVHDFGEGGDLGMLAVDGLGRIWATGWWHIGLKVYNPHFDKEFTYVPNLPNTDYKVTTFTRGGEHYVAYMNQGDAWSDNSPQVYGYDLAANYAQYEYEEAPVMAKIGCSADPTGEQDVTEFQQNETLYLRVSDVDLDPEDPRCRVRAYARQRMQRRGHGRQEISRFILLQPREDGSYTGSIDLSAFREGAVRLWIRVDGVKKNHMVRRSTIYVNPATP